MSTLRAPCSLALTSCFVDALLQSLLARRKCVCVLGGGIGLRPRRGYALGDGGGGT